MYSKFQERAMNNDQIPHLKCIRSTKRNNFLTSVYTMKLMEKLNMTHLVSICNIIIYRLVKNTSIFPKTVVRSILNTLNWNSKYYT